MTFDEIIKRIEKENLLIKETFYSKRTIYECFTENNVRVFNLTYLQYRKILKLYNTKVFKEEYGGFVKRYFKVIF